MVLVTIEDYGLLREQNASVDQLRGALVFYLAIEKYSKIIQYHIVDIYM